MDTEIRFHSQRGAENKDDNVCVGSGLKQDISKAITIPRHPKIIPPLHISQSLTHTTTGREKKYKVYTLLTWSRDDRSIWNWRLGVAGAALFVTTLTWSLDLDVSICTPVTPPASALLWRWITRMNPEAVLALAAPHLKEIEAASAPGHSDIQKFYCHSTVFVTGGSGFIGKQLLEKLFRSCNIQKIFMLLRAKKKKTVQERLMEILKDPVFDAVKKLKPDFADRIQTVEGDVSELNLGISEQDWNIMVEEVEIIFHVAATTRFDEHLQDATFINVRGTREALALAQACRQLKSFVHVSTAYSHATSSREGTRLLEQFHHSPVPPETLLQMAETVERSTLADITREFIKGWPNTYTFTKAVAEEQVRILAAELPVCIVRPSIVISSYREPCPAWLDMSCSFSASGFIIGSGLGLIHVMQAAKNTDMSLVPVDYVNNALITAAWEVGTSQRDGPRTTDIYNVVTSSENNLVWDESRFSLYTSEGEVSSGELVSDIFKPASQKESSIVEAVNIYGLSYLQKVAQKNLEESIVKVGEQFPTPLAIWKSFVFTTPSSNMLLLLSVLMHYIPAVVLDCVLTLLGKERRFLKLYKKVHKLTVSLSYFMTSLHNMDDTNLAKLKQKQSDIDRIIFNFDMKPMDWQEFVKLWCLGVRKYVLKDGLKDTERARRNQYLYGLLNYVILGIYVYLFWIILSFFNCVFGRLFYG